MSIEQYSLNIKKYIDTLPTTNILIVYFTNSRNNKTITDPYIVEDVQITKIDNKEWFVNTSPSGKWSNVYKQNSLICIVKRMDTNVVSISTKFTNSFEQIGSGITCEEGIIGDHLTIGLTEFNNRHMLDTHTTTYTEDPKKLSNFIIEHPIKCIIDLHESLNKDTKCLSKQGKESNYLYINKYKDEPEILPIIEYFKNIANTKIESGIRGGTFIINNGKKHYLKKNSSIRGGAITERVQNIIDMIYDKLIRHVLNSIRMPNSLPVNASMIYDTQNYFELNNPVLVIIYDIEEADRRLMFYLNLEHVNMAYEYEELSKLDLNRNTPADNYKKRCSDELEQQREIHIRTVRAVAI